MNKRERILDVSVDLDTDWHVRFGLYDVGSWRR